MKSAAMASFVGTGIELEGIASHSLVGNSDGLNFGPLGFVGWQDWLCDGEVAGGPLPVPVKSVALW